MTTESPVIRPQSVAVSNPAGSLAEYQRKTRLLPRAIVQATGGALLTRSIVLIWLLWNGSVGMGIGLAQEPSRAGGGGGDGGTGGGGGGTGGEGGGGLGEGSPAAKDTASRMAGVPPGLKGAAAKK